MGGDYLFLFLDFNDFVSDRADAVRAQLDAFGARLGPKAWVISIFERMSFNAAEEVFEKRWHEEFREQLTSSPDPAMLVIEQDFDTFDPRQHKWAAIWFAEHDPQSVYRLLNELANRVRRDEDLFSYLNALGRKDRFRRVARYFEVKPQLFGVSLNSSAIFENLAAAQRASYRRGIRRFTSPSAIVRRVAAFACKERPGREMAEWCSSRFDAVGTLSQRLADDLRAG